MICLDGLDLIARYLADHPEGVIPNELTFVPSTNTLANPSENMGFWSHLQEVKKCERFVELTGEVGDVVLMHPLMLHSASKNYLDLKHAATGALPPGVHFKLVEAVADHICETLFLQDRRVRRVKVKIVKLAISEAGEAIGITLVRHRP